MKLNPFVKIFLHIAAWALYVFLQSAMYMDMYEMEDVRRLPDGTEQVTRITFPETFQIAFIDTLIELPGKVIIVYINLFLLLELYVLRKRKLLMYFVTLIVAYAVADTIQRILVIKVFFPILRPELDTERILTLSAHLQYAAGCFSALVFTSSITVLLHYFREKKKNDEIEKQRLDTELKYLKNQINPHFFFNTLNSLYGLALDKSESTPDAILQLSSIMDYVLHGSNRKDVPITDEISILENYIALEKLRYDKRVSISFFKEGDLGSYKIAPLLLLPLLENAFKHGAQLQEKGTTEIIISARVDSEGFDFSIKNSIPDDTTRKLKPSGIGLENLKRRLELLYGPLCQFSIDSDKDIFIVTLLLKHN